MGGSVLTHFCQTQSWIRSPVLAIRVQKFRETKRFSQSKEDDVGTRNWVLNRICKSWAPQPWEHFKCLKGCHTEVALVMLAIIPELEKLSNGFKLQEGDSNCYEKLPNNKSSSRLKSNTQRAPWHSTYHICWISDWVGAVLRDLKGVF